MPESAENRLTAEYLNSMLENKIITDFVFLGGQYEKERPTGFSDFFISLPLLVGEVKCKGKLIYISCYNEYSSFFILHSLRMTGSWREKQDDHCRWYIEIEGKKKLWFRDPRCFATLYFTDDEDTMQETLEKLGPDILTDSFTLEIWRKKIADHPNKNITAFLMNQTIISGCGNYIKAEALYYSKISPLRKVSSLTENEAEKLYEALRIIPRLAYNNKGLSFRDYTDQYGKKGFYEFYLKIYNKKHATATKTADGRTTYWDPDIQK